jgi:hypothetical protein
MRDKDDLELLIESALLSYGDPGPCSGLEQRILARVAHVRGLAEFRPTQGRRLFWPFLAFPAVACVLLFLVVPRTPRHEVNQAKQPHRVERPAPELPAFVAHQTAQPASGHSASGHSRRARQIVASRAVAEQQFALNSSPLPKLDVFPTPRPLTTQEQALVFVATRTTESQREALVKTQKPNDSPLSIAAIHIPPLETPEEGKN